jgi:hypothetical protein
MKKRYHDPYCHMPEAICGPPVPVAHSRWTVGTGVMEFVCPTRMSAECFHEMEEVMALFMRQIKRMARIEQQAKP